MKNTKKLSTSVAVFAITSMLMLLNYGASAQRYVKLEVHDQAAGLLKLEINPVKDKLPVHIKLKDAAGNVLHSEYSRKGKYKGLINLSKLAVGQYDVELVSDESIIRKTLLKDATGLIVLDQEKYFYSYVNYVDKDKKLYVRSTSNFGQPLTLRLMDSKGEILYEERDINASSFISKLNLSVLPAGTYSIHVVNGTLFTSKAISIRNKAVTDKPFRIESLITNRQAQQQKDSVNLVE